MARFLHHRAAPAAAALVHLLGVGALPLLFTSDHLYPTGFFLADFVRAGVALLVAAFAALPRWRGAPWAALAGVALAAGCAGRALGWSAADASIPDGPDGPGFWEIATWNPIAMVLLAAALVVFARHALADGRGART